MAALHTPQPPGHMHYALREPQGPLSEHCNADLGGQAFVSHGVVVGGPNVITTSGTQPTTRCCRDKPLRVVLSTPPADYRTC